MALIETLEYGNLIANNNHPLAVATVTIASGEGELKRGTVLSRNGSNKFIVTAAAVEEAECILAQDVDATSADVVAEVYVSGDFNRTALINTISEEAELTLKQAGIYLVSGIDYARSTLATGASVNVAEG